MPYGKWMKLLDIMIVGLIVIAERQVNVRGGVVMVRKAGRRRKKIERFLRDEFKKTGKQVKKQPVNYYSLYRNTPEGNEAELYEMYQ